jgi:hypothetical protein
VHVVQSSHRSLNPRTSKYTIDQPYETDIQTYSKGRYHEQASMHRRT